MNQEQYLHSLQDALREHQVGNIPEILADYREHFAEGMRKGKTEELIAVQLGYPTAIAKAYQAESLIRQVKRKEEVSEPFQWSLILQILGRFVLIAPFNFILLLIPGFIVGAILMAGWGTTFAIGGAGFAILGVAAKASLFSLSWWVGLGAVSTGLATLGLATIFFLIGFLITKQIFLALMSYLQWNLKFVLEKK